LSYFAPRAVLEDNSPQNHFPLSGRRIPPRHELQQDIDLGLDFTGFEQDPRTRAFGFIFS
jgi:hypothetical protein